MTCPLSESAELWHVQRIITNFPFSEFFSSALSSSSSSSSFQGKHILLSSKQQMNGVREELVNQRSI